MKAIILAGGFGKRIRSVVGDDIPKCMAPIRGKPVIEYIIDSMLDQNIHDITLSLHYKAEAVTNHLGDTVKYKIEEEPLGTGGAIKNCLSDDEEPTLVVNGDTIAKINYHDMRENHTRPLTIARAESHGWMTSAGIYIVNPSVFDNFGKKVFSFERDVIPHVLYSFYQIPWFIDIGTPEGYEKAQNAFA